APSCWRRAGSCLAGCLGVPSMPPSPSIVPGIDRDTCLVLDDFGPIGRAWSEIDVEDTDFETVITNLLDGCRFSNPVRVVAFNTAEGLVSRHFGGRGA